MAYKSSYKKRSGYRKKSSKRTKPWYKKKYNALQAGEYALKQISYLKSMINSEVHRSETTGFVNTTATNTGSMFHITGLSQGDDASNRTGNSVLLKNILMKGYVSFNSSGTVGQVVKIWLIEDHQQASDTNPTYAEVFNQQNIVSTLNSQHLGRFSILKEMTICQKNDQWTVPLTLFKKFYMHHCRYNGTATTDTQKGHLYLCFVSNRAAAGNPPSLYFDKIMSFHDN